MVSASFLWSVAGFGTTVVEMAGTVAFVDAVAVDAVADAVVAAAVGFEVKPPRLLQTVPRRWSYPLKILLPRKWPARS